MAFCCPVNIIHGETAMIQKLIVGMSTVLATLVATMGFAFAQVDVNKADAAALGAVKGVGPKMSQAILDERAKGGAFKDWADFQKRVSGVGEKSAAKLSQGGLQIAGKSKEAGPAAKPAAAKAAPAAAPAAANQTKPANM
jgi:competence protein ComEA